MPTTQSPSVHTGCFPGRQDNVIGNAAFPQARELHRARDALLERLTELGAARREDVCPDRAEVDCLGPGGIRSLLSGHNALQEDGRRLVLRNVHGAPLRALALTGAPQELHVEYDRNG